MFHLIYQIFTDGWVTLGMLMKQNGKYRYYERQVHYGLPHIIPNNDKGVFEGSWNRDKKCKVPIYK